MASFAEGKAHDAPLVQWGRVDGVRERVPRRYTHLNFTLIRRASMADGRGRGTVERRSGFRWTNDGEIIAGPLSGSSSSGSPVGCRVSGLSVSGLGSVFLPLLAPSLLKSELTRASFGDKFASRKRETSVAFRWYLFWSEDTSDWTTFDFLTRFDLKYAKNIFRSQTILFGGPLCSIIMSPER